MIADDRELVRSLLAVDDQACDRLASLILAAYLEPGDVSAAIDQVKVHLGIEKPLESIEDVLTTARSLGRSLLAIHGYR
jgi:hypothetical protein